MRACTLYSLWGISLNIYEYSVSHIVCCEHVQREYVHDRSVNMIYSNMHHIVLDWKDRHMTKGVGDLGLAKRICGGHLGKRSRGIMWGNVVANWLLRIKTEAINGVCCTLY